MIALAALLAGVLAWHGPIAQWADYHAFADVRAWLGIPNAADVLSNLPFALVGAWGWMRLRRPEPSWPAQNAWRLFCAGLLCTAVGSAVYHLAPDNTALVFDRIPIAGACAALLCAFLAERVDRRWSSLPALAAAWLAATLSVVIWWAGELHGTGDLRAYLFVQCLPMLLVPAGLLLPRAAWPAAGPAGTDDPPYTVAPSAWWAVLALYAAAKGAEVADHALFGMLGMVSGHTLKHLLAALAAGWIVRAAVPPRRPGGRPPAPVSCGSRR